MKRATRPPRAQNQSRDGKFQPANHPCWSAYSNTNTNTKTNTKTAGHPNLVYTLKCQDEVYIEYNKPDILIQRIPMKDRLE